MPIGLYDTVNAAVTLYLRLKGEGDARTARSLKAEAARLVEAFTEVMRSAEDLEKGRTRLDEAVRRIDSAISFEESVELKQFFEQVADALIESQKKLDEKSNEYNRILDRVSPTIPKTWYSIPSLKAEMKVGFSQISSRGVNVVLFQNTSQKQSYGESTVTFEIAAGPLPPGQDQLAVPAAVPGPPPAPGATEAFEVLESADLSQAPSRTALRGELLEAELLEAIESGRPRQSFPLAPARREEFVKALASQLSVGQASLLLSTRSRRAVLPSKPEPTAQPYLVLCAALPERSRRKKPALMAWYVEASGEAMATRTSIFTYQRALDNHMLAMPPGRQLREWAAKSPRKLHYLVRNLGDLVMTVVLHAASFEADFLVVPAALKAVVPPVFDEASTVLGKPDGAILLRAVHGDSPVEWVGLHAAIVTGKKVDAFSIPDNDELLRWTRSSPSALVRLAERLENLLLSIVKLLSHA